MTHMTEPRLGRSLLRLTAVALMTTALTGCYNFKRLTEIGKPPELSQVENPVAKPDYAPVVLPMPAPEPPVRHANSLWRTGAKAFFKDQRAARVGDLLTVKIAIDESSKFENRTERERTETEDTDIPALLGFQAKLATFAKFLPSAVNPANLIQVGNAVNTKGDGEIERSEELTLTVAAVVTQVLPNGNLVVQGRQEIRVNFEVREVYVSGVVRPEDIASDNTIEHTRLAEARIAYGGRGQLSDLQQPRYGYQILDQIMPF